ncbi:MAG: glycosyl transferase 4 family protein [Xanthomonadaceae bacterium]|nr:glycosyl transferase 4 family protein [Xanthomonadaceae bacterium]
MPEGSAGWLASWIAALFLLAFAGTWLARRYAMHRRLLDEPGDRRSHVLATPRGGGIAIVVVMLLAIGYLALDEPASRTLLGAIAGGLFLVGGVGWMDDHQPQSPLTRLAVQALASLLLAWGIWSWSGSVPAALSAFAASMILTNVWNFMDGIDGLAASQALLVATGYGAIAFGSQAPVSYAVGGLALALAAACLGFLPFNFPRARIFLGDVGSGALGYLLAALLVWVGCLRQPIQAPVLLLPLSAFLIDASLTLFGRMVGRQRWWLPHTEHAYQHWVRRLPRHSPVTLAYAAWTLGAIVLMLATSSRSVAFMMLSLGIATLGGMSAWLALRRPHRRTGRGDRE